MECGDQVLRNFLNGLVIYLRGTKDNPKNPGEVLLGMTPVADKAIKKGPEKREHKGDFKSKQLKNVDKAITPVKYKNKKKS